MQALLELLNTLRQNESEGVDTHCIHFIETGISKLHEYPYIMIRDYRVRLAVNGTCTYTCMYIILCTYVH